MARAPRYAAALATSWPSQHCHYQPTLEGKTELCVIASTTLPRPLLEAGAAQIEAIIMMWNSDARRIDVSEGVGHMGLVFTKGITQLALEGARFAVDRD
jgi:hypothetical protein